MLNLPFSSCPIGCFLLIKEKKNNKDELKNKIPFVLHLLAT